MKKKRPVKLSSQSEVQLPKLSPEEEQQLDYDICCCIEELEKMLSRNLTEKQKKTAEMSLRILRNPGETFIKKKQVMRQQFGDYKCKFENKKKEVISNLNDNSVGFKNVNLPQASVFYKKHEIRNSVTDKTINICQTENDQNRKECKLNNGVCQISNSGSSSNNELFKFNF